MIDTKREYIRFILYVCDAVLLTVLAGPFTTVHSDVTYLYAAILLWVRSVCPPGHTELSAAAVVNSAATMRVAMASISDSVSVDFVGLGG
jgi:hypothetical protein